MKEWFYYKEAYEKTNKPMAQQTAVEWLVEQLRMQTPLYTKNEMIEIAKEMEREQRFKDFKAGQDSMEEGGKGFEQYYTETYGE